MTNRNHIAFDADFDSFGDAIEVTPSDDTDLGITKAIYVGGTGDLVVTMASGNDVTFVDVPAGFLLNLRVQKVLAATDASQIVALY
jgi:hypothetical protein